MRIDKVKGQVLQLGCTKPMQCSRLGEQCLESCSAEGGLGVLFESWLDMSQDVPRWPRKPYHLVHHIFLQFYVSSAISAEDFLHVVIFGSLPAANVLSLVLFLSPIFFSCFVSSFFHLLFPQKIFFLYPSFIIYITVLPSTLSIFLVLYSFFPRMSLQTSAVWVSRE